MIVIKNNVKDKNKYTNIIVKIIQQIFPTVSYIRIDKEYDPETTDSWIVFCITVSGSLKIILNQYNEYTRKFIETIPYPERNLFRLSYNISNSPL